jgi:hypothetical protein
MVIKEKQKTTYEVSSEPNAQERFCTVKMTIMEMAILCITASEGNWLRSAVQLAVPVKPP